MIRVLVCGDRDWTDEEFIFDELDKLAVHYMRCGHNLLIIQGKARGADTFARNWAKHRSVKFKDFPANWTKYGRAAGPIRNQQQLDVGNPHLCLAFHSNIKRSKGTKDMVRRCRKAGVETRILSNRKEKR